MPPCFSVMPMPSVMPRLVDHGAKRRIVGRACRCTGITFGQQIRLLRQRRHRGPRHGDRAEMPGLDLRGHVEFCRAYHFRRAAGRLAVGIPGRIVHAGMRAVRHQLVIGRVKLDLVAAVAAGIEGAQLWRILVGDAARAPPSRPSPNACRTRTIRCCAEAPPLAATASTSGRSTVYRSTSSNGGDWLKTSWVANDAWLMAGPGTVNHLRGVIGKS